MNQLIDVRINKVFAAKNDEETEFAKFHEFVLLVDAPNYLPMRDGTIARDRQIKELRFTIADEVFDTFIDQLQSLRSAKHSDLS